MEEKTVGDILRIIQTELKAPKNLYNKFGKYKYRSAESILEAVKPLLKEYEANLVLTDDIVACGNRIYVKATASFTYHDGCVMVQAFAREDEVKKGMDGSQITGTASSYARKYALNGLFLIDDAKDTDTEEYHNEVEARAKEQEMEADLDKKITEAEADRLKKIAKPNQIEWFLKKCGVDRLTAITKRQYAEFIRALQVKEDGKQSKAE